MGGDMPTLQTWVSSQANAEKGLLLVLMIAAGTVIWLILIREQSEKWARIISNLLAIFFVVTFFAAFLAVCMFQVLQ